MTRTAQLAQGILALGLECAPDVADRLDAFLVALAKWNRVYNLTSVPESDWVPDHILDSLSLVPFITGASIVDVGSGGGLPGVPLAIWFPERSITLIDSSGKKVRFLTQVKIELGLENVSVVQTRAESFVGEFDHVTCRALASLADIASMTAHLLAKGGSILAMKGSVSAEELAHVSALSVAQRVSLDVPHITSERTLVVMTAKMGSE